MPPVTFSPCSTDSFVPGDIEGHQAFRDCEDTVISSERSVMVLVLYITEQDTGVCMEDGIFQALFKNPRLIPAASNG